jgi:hypothetical protein
MDLWSSTFSWCLRKSYRKWRAIFRKNSNKDYMPIFQHVILEGQKVWKLYIKKYHFIGEMYFTCWYYFTYDIVGGGRKLLLRIVWFG